MNGKIIYNVDDIKLECEYKLLNRYKQSKNTSDYTLKNTLGNDNSDNKNESKIKRKSISHYTPNSHALTHTIAQLQRKRELLHIFLPTSKNIVNTDINEHEVKHIKQQNESMYASNTDVSNHNENDIIDHTIKTTDTSHNTQSSQINVSRIKTSNETNITFALIIAKTKVTTTTTIS